MPAATMIGQYDGDGRCTPDASKSGSARYVILSRRRSLPLASCSYFWCHQPASAVTVGSTSKLCAGGGEDVPHSSVRASHGSGSWITFLRLPEGGEVNTRRHS